MGEAFYGGKKWVSRHDLREGRLGEEQFPPVLACEESETLVLVIPT